MILPTKYARVRWDEEHAQEWIGESFTWTDRDSYLAWVVAWKDELTTRIMAIRSQKALRKDPDDATRSMAQHERHYLRIECANLFLLRAMAKRLSNQQRETRLTAMMPTE